MKAEGSGLHALVYDPNSGMMYDVNHPNNGNTDGFMSWLNGGAKSVGYKFNMKNEADRAKFWAFGGGRGELWLSPVQVSNPAAATAFFSGQVGKEWDYNFFSNNCKGFVCEGLAAGGANVPMLGPSPGVWNGGFTMHWNSSMTAPASLPAWQPRYIAPSPGDYKH